MRKWSKFFSNITLDSIILHTFTPELDKTMEINTYTTESIVINNPSEKLLNLVHQMQVHKQKLREDIRCVKPLFTLRAN